MMEEAQEIEMENEEKLQKPGVKFNEIVESFKK
jgi:hypothetical protein